MHVDPSRGIHSTRLGGRVEPGKRRFQRAWDFTGVFGHPFVSCVRGKTELLAELPASA